MMKIRHYGGMNFGKIRKSGKKLQNKIFFRPISDRPILDCQKEFFDPRGRSGQKIIIR